jgi:hypothetical protein
VSKNIYICSRETLLPYTSDKLSRICKRLAPTNITPAEHVVVVKGDIGYGIMNPTRTLIIKGNSL